MKLMVYPFKITMRQFCRFLEKHDNIRDTIRPTSILYINGQSIVYYEEDAGFDNSDILKKLLDLEINAKGLLDYPLIRCEIDTNIINAIAGVKRLIRRGEGTFWDFHWNDSGIVTGLGFDNNSKTFYRTNHKFVGGQEIDGITFVYPKNSIEFDLIYLTSKLRGVIFENITLESNLSLEYQRTIEWKRMDN